MCFGSVVWAMDCCLGNGLIAPVRRDRKLSVNRTTACAPYLKGGRERRTAIDEKQSVVAQRTGRGRGRASQQRSDASSVQAFSRIGSRLDGGTVSSWISSSGSTGSSSSSAYNESTPQDEVTNCRERAGLAHLERDSESVLGTDRSTNVCLIEKKQICGGCEMLSPIVCTSE